MHAKFLICLLLCCLALAAAPTARPAAARPGLAEASLAAGDEFWDNEFAPPGVEGTIHALALDRGGQLYAGGSFRNAGGLIANNIARWDGRAWQPVGGGLDAPVHALVFSGTQLLAGGAFTQAGGVPAAGLASWDGVAWSAFGGGVSGAGATVHALLRDGGRLYAGGSFTRAGSTAAGSLARWDGSAWSDLGGGVSGSPTAGISPTVRALLLRNGVLYAGGSFLEAGGEPASNIASLGGGEWSALGAGTDGPVRALQWSGGLVAGGGFARAGGSAAPQAARWDGSAWSALAGLPAGASVAAMLVHRGLLHVGLENPGAARAIQRWTGSAWQPAGPRFTGTTTSNSVRAFVQTSALLYAGGQFALASEGSRLLPANGALELVGDEWDVLGRGNQLVCADPACAATALQGSVYVSSNVPASFALPYAWDGIAWSPLALPGTFAAAPVMASDGATLYAADSPDAGGPPWRVARLGDTGWSELGTGPGGPVSHLAAGDAVYAAYRPAADGPGPATRIARWDGSAWAEIGALSGQFAAVQTLHLSGTHLLAGGTFASIGGVSARNIARWDGSAWAALGTPPAGEALSIVGGADGLYAAFDREIARWDGSAWSVIGSAGSRAERVFVQDLALMGDTLFASGMFERIGEVGALRIARWDGTAWQPLGSGIDGGEIADLEVQGDSLFVIGQFTAAGGKPSLHVARWNTVRIQTYVPLAVYERAGGSLQP